MAARALIIAIENYPKVDGGDIAKNLPGTLKAALNFKAWLLEKWEVEGRQPRDAQLLFCSKPMQPDGYGATSKDIRQALLKLKADGQSSTEELYFFFSGHGFSFVEKPGSRADIIISADFEKAELSPDSCLNLDELVLWLRLHLGPGRHYYFVDACRNSLSAGQIRVGALLPIDPQASGEASTFILQSTVEGAVALVGGPFPAALIAGLRGKGRAKTWDKNVNDAMFVRYDSLRSYLKATSAAGQKITSKTAGTDGESDAILATLRPIPLSTCGIKINNVQIPVVGEITYRRGRSSLPERRIIDSQQINLTLEPDDYTVSVRVGGIVLKPRDPVPVDLYEDRQLTFEKIFEEGASAPADLESIAVTDVDIIVPDQSSLRLRNVATGDETFIDASCRVRLPRGRYFATFCSSTGHIFLRKEIQLEVGKNTIMNLAEWRNSSPHMSIASKLPDYGGGIEFSELLGGPVTDPDLNLWLALLGGGRILESQGDYSNLAKFRLHDFANEQVNASPIYLLAGFDDPGIKLKVGVSRTAEVTWVTAEAPADMPGIQEAYFSTPPGWYLVSTSIQGQAPYTIASITMRNRAMLITLTLDEENYPCISQYLLPLGHLLNKLPRAVRIRLRSRNQLNDVRFLAQASRAFRNRRDVRTAIPESELNDLLYTKWLDPIASSLAAYELLRRGKVDELGDVVTNMKHFFHELPDASALVKLSGGRSRRPQGVPLFFDGLRAFPDYVGWLPLPASHLDFASPWTAWRAAVNA